MANLGVSLVIEFILVVLEQRYGELYVPFHQQAAIVGSL